MTDSLAQARKVYLDANICIYFVEGSEHYRGLARRAVAIAADRGIALFSSQLCLCRMHVWYCQERQTKTAVTLSAAVRKWRADRNGGDRSYDPRPRGKARWVSGLKLLDSIHLATALQSGCDAYLTNDKRFRDTDGLRIAQLSDIEA